MSFTNHFGVNFGKAYKYHALPRTRSLEEAASCVRSTLQHLSWAAVEAAARMGHAPASFNELLALGYCQDQSIGFHDDGEQGLGPTIATLSLGAPALMQLRMKARHYAGVTRAGMLSNAPPLPGCREQDARQHAWDAGQISSAACTRKAGHDLARRLGLSYHASPPSVLDLELSHGDVVIMHGRELQLFYEHAVWPQRGLRFALTCRWVEEEHGT